MTAPPPQPVAFGIETSCDDTAAAVVDADGRVLTSIVSSQLAAHRPFGGVVPEIASREHLSNWPAVEAAALEEAGLEPSDVDLVAATHAPGLIGALLVGFSVGKGMAYGLGVPFHAVHHLEGHLFSPFLDPDGEAAAEVPERFHGLVVSGGHTAIYRVEGGTVETLAETRDDAFGEVFDKVGKRIGLEYPQGPVLDEIAEAAEPTRKRLPVATCSDGSLDFSYSGLKSQTLVELGKLEEEGVEVDLGGKEIGHGREVSGPLRELLSAFRAAAVAQLVDRLDRVVRSEPIELLAVSGGAAANRLLRRELEVWSGRRSVPLRLVPHRYAADNAAMIAWAAVLRSRRGHSGDPLTSEAAGRTPLVLDPAGGDA